MLNIMKAKWFDIYACKAQPKHPLDPNRAANKGMWFLVTFTYTLADAQAYRDLVLHNLTFTGVRIIPKY